MAITKYYTPRESRYMPALFDMYKDYYAKQDVAYETGQSTIDQFYTTLGKMKAYSPEDEKALFERKQYYEDKLNSLIDSANGRPMQILPGLREINREFVVDATEGPLAGINSRYSTAANDYATYKKNVEEGNWDFWTQAMAKKSIGKGIAFPKSVDKLGIVKDNLSPELATTLPFSGIVGTAQSLIMSDPSVQQQGQMISTLFADQPEVVQSWQEDVINTAKAAALGKYKYDAKLQEGFEKNLSVNVMAKNPYNRVAIMAKEAAEIMKMQHADYLQTKAELSSDPEATYAAEVKRMEDMAWLTADKNWKTAHNEEDLTNADIYAGVNFEEYQGRMFPRKDFEIRYADFPTSMIEKSVENWANQNYTSYPTLPGDFPKKRNITDEFITVAEEDSFERKLKPEEKVLLKLRSQSYKDFIDFNEIATTQMIPQGIRPQFNGRDIVEWEKDIFGDATHMGDINWRKMFISDGENPFERKHGAYNLEEIYKAAGISGNDEQKREQLMQVMDNSDKGAWFPFVWGGKDWMYGVAMFNLPGKDGKEFQVAVELDPKYSKKIEDQFGPILETLGKSELEKEKDFLEKKGKGFVLDYRGPGDYTVAIPKVVVNIETRDRGNIPAIIKAVDVQVVAQGEPGKPRRDIDGKIVYDTKIVPQIWEVDDKGNPTMQIVDEDFSVNSFAEFSNALINGFLTTAKSGYGENFGDLLNIKPDMVKKPPKIDINYFSEDTE